MDKDYEELLLHWPKGPDGAPEEAVLLKRDCDLSGWGNITCSILMAYGIPYYTKRPGSGEMMFIRGGFAPEGIDIYVPASLSEQAQTLLNAPAEFAEEEYEEETI